MSKKKKKNTNKIKKKKKKFRNLYHLLFLKKIINAKNVIIGLGGWWNTLKWELINLKFYKEIVHSAKIRPSGISVGDGSLDIW